MKTSNKILLEHGSGGQRSRDLIVRTFLPAFRNERLASLEDSAAVPGEDALRFTTDTYVVQPLFFPGGSIGTLAVAGTINDLAVCGAAPLALSAAFVIEEGFALADLDRVTADMARTAREAGVPIVTGDTKVVGRGAADGLFVNTAGVGRQCFVAAPSPRRIRPGDAVLVNGTVGDHGAAILCCRQDLGLTSDIRSDAAPLHGLVEAVRAVCPDVSCMRDATRGGLGAVLVELAEQSGREIVVEEAAVPVRGSVRGVCEILGFDPLFLANEGKLVLFCPRKYAADALRAMQSHPLGREAALIGEVTAKDKGRALLKTAFGGERQIDLPAGELVPRIC